VNLTEQAKHLAARQRRAGQIIVEAERFKVCEQCRSISYRHVPTCSICGAYRFDENPDLIRDTAREMSSHPFPVTAGTVPRFTT